MVLASQNDSKFGVFFNFNEKRRFCKNYRFALTGATFLRFRASKNHKKTRKIGTKKHGAKIKLLLDFESIFGGPGDPK